ncbi:peptidase M48 Ste24p [Sphingobacteriales bacterium UPWRP_1]|nr:peptidase M48 Ste24p [Sphingobacteriales bacterium TSM_CSM]PSJ75833.1 peptidase M48 Ste24p [Sphingobacteriales bacterium UPWRP_1]
MSNARTVGKRGGLVAAILMALFALFQYYSNTQYNAVLGEKQHVALSVDQEIALGLQSAPQMAEQHGGLYPDERAQNYVKQIGKKIVAASEAKESNYQFDFHLLADPQVINAFALPGGQVFITLALFNRLENEDQLAGVLGHEIGHVIARHSAQRIAQQQLAEGLSGAAVLATYDPNNPASTQTAQVAAVIGNLVTMKYGREDELQSDELGVRFMSEAGYDPNALIGVMEILKAAAGGNRQPEFFSTHPNPENRIENIKAAIEKYYKGK